MNVGGIHLNSTAGIAERSDVQTPLPSEKTEEKSAAFSLALSKNLQQPTPNRQVVAAKRTQLTSDEASAALRDAWEAHFGEAPREETVAVLTAQWSHETGNGRSMYNYNFGGIKGTGPSGLTVSQRTKEGWGATERTIRDNFRAYASASEGAADYVSLLRRRYAGAIEAAHQGDPGQFVRELKKGGYFTGNEGAYIRSVSARTEQLLGRAPSIESGQPPQGVALPTPPQRAPVPTEVRQVSAAPRAEAPPRAAAATINWEPNQVNIQAFDDALSRAALRIALDSGTDQERGLFGTDDRRDRG